MNSDDNDLLSQDRPPKKDTSGEDRRLRWRLVLGAGAESLGNPTEHDWNERDRAISFLYDREHNRKRKRNIRPSAGSLDDSNITVIDWINSVHELFPRKTIETIEKDALERYQLEEMVANPELLKRAKPSEHLLKAVLRTKHLMNQEVLAIARHLIKQVVDELLQKLSQEIRGPFYGAKDRRKRSFHKTAKNLDAKKTIERNLKHYDPESGKLFIETPIFNSRIKRNADKWTMIILVDQSGSMISNVIHSAIIASIFYSISALRTRLIAFDTNVIDLSESIVDPVEVLMSVQLGGGTDIAAAVDYASSLLENPNKTVVALISDFYEGGNEKMLISRIKNLAESGAKLLGLAALDRESTPVYNHNLAERLASVGMPVGAMTPGELAVWVADKIK